MPITAKLNYLRLAPRKARLVANLIRGKAVPQARALLDFSLKRGSLSLKKLLDSAVANAKNDFEVSKEENLYIAKITVDEGPKLKRWRARARGRAMEIQKKTSHITLVLEIRESKAQGKAKGKQSKKESKAKEKIKQKNESKN